MQKPVTFASGTLLHFTQKDAPKGWTKIADDPDRPGVILARKD